MALITSIRQVEDSDQNDRIINVTNSAALGPSAVLVPRKSFVRGDKIPSVPTGHFVLSSPIDLATAQNALIVQVFQYNVLTTVWLVMGSVSCCCGR
jgi:hypothetical protein